MISGIEKDWVSPEGYHCVVRLHPRAGHRMGYIFIPTGDKALMEPKYGIHKFGGKERKYLEYNDYDIEAPGGLTYGSEAMFDDTYPAEEDKPGIWFGFDCAHCDDKPDFDAWEAMHEEDDDKTAFDMMKKIDVDIWNKPGSIDNRHIWTIEEVANECESMSRQFYIMEKGKLNEEY